MSKQITVLKFGSSVLRSEDDLPQVVHEIYRHWRSGSKVLVVVSAFGNTTDELIERAKNIATEPQAESFAALLATGEANSAALVGLAVDRAGIPAKVLSPAQTGIRTSGSFLDAEPLTTDISRLNDELEKAVVIVSGFVGQNNDGDLTLLGRGGSDLTAMFLANELNGRCLLIKDVDGLYESNPNEINLPHPPRRFAKANWDTAINIGGGVVQPKAIRFAQERNFSFSITATGAPVETEIYGGHDLLADLKKPRKPLRVALLGCGTVGGGVYERLAALPELFEVIGIAVKDPDKDRIPEIPTYLLTADAVSLIEQSCDVVVELIGVTNAADKLITRAIQLNRHVVTANKALLSENINRLENQSKDAKVKLHYSAAIGGAMPALERISLPEFSDNLISFSGILNGTCNFICDELAQEKDFKVAVKAAQEAGFAEANPTLDLNGTDAAQKLLLLARAAFGITLSLDEIELEGIENLSEESVTDAKENGFAIRLVAECRQSGEGIKAAVKPRQIPFSHPFAQIQGAENCLLFEQKKGEISFVRGRGAGRWATTEAVIADLFEIQRELSTAQIPCFHHAAAAAGTGSLVNSLQEVYV